MRLQIINDALLATGNEPLNEEYDGSDEWRAADSAYRRSVMSLLSRHRWSFATKTGPLGGRLPATPSGHGRYSEAFAFPPDFLHLKGAFYCGAPFTAFEIVDQSFCCGQASGVTIEYVRIPPDGQWPHGFLEVLAVDVEARLLRGLNEDLVSARSRDADVERMLGELRSLSDQQGGRRAVLRSRTMERRLGYRSPLSRWPYGG